MSERHDHLAEYDQPALYAIRIKGHLDDRWIEWFDGMTLTREENGVTLLTGPVMDQAMLHGFLRTVRNLGLPLLSVTRRDPKEDAVLDVRSGNTPHLSRKEGQT
jgi:hypothetical protein